MRRPAPIRVLFFDFAPREHQSAMPDDYLQYERLVEDALRDVMRKALELVAEKGLEGDHYFHITFRTDHPGVDIPATLRREYPDEMPVILQNAFWDLEVDETGFAVSLSFNRVQQRLTIPFDAITTFQDPPASFRLQFQAGEEDEDDATVEGQAEAPADVTKPALPAEILEHENSDDVERGKVIALDAFRNK